MLFAPTCVVCGRRGSALCVQCAAGLRPAPGVPVPPGIDRFGSLLAYEGVGRSLVVNLKYHNARAAVGVVAEPLAELARPALAGVPAPVVVTWAPTTAARRRARGYDQAALLARAVARRLGLRAVGLLARAPAAPQTGRTRQQRLEGPHFAVRGTVSVPPSVLLIDDVCTSGATLAAAGQALRQRGAIWLIVVCLAQTPLNHPARSAETTN